MAIEKWEIEVGPITSKDADGFMDVEYSIRYPRGSFKVTQRVRNSRQGYEEAHDRVKRMVTWHDSASESQPQEPGSATSGEAPQLRDLAIKARAARTAWFEAYGVPVSHTFANFADAIGELINRCERFVDPSVPQKGKTKS